MGYMEKNDRGRLAITRVILRPAIRFRGAKRPDEGDISQMHEEAHDNCFIANSVCTQVVVEQATVSAA